MILLSPNQPLAVFGSGAGWDGAAPEDLRGMVQHLSIILFF
jgi:hypothetical protein